MSSVSASLEEVLEKSIAETSGGKGIFGEEGRMTLGTSLEQGEEVGAVASGSVRMSGTSSMRGEEVSATAFEFAGVSGASSVSDLSWICNPTDIMWFDNDHAKGLPASFIEYLRYPNPVPLRSSGVPSTSIIPCS